MDTINILMLEEDGAENHRAFRHVPGKIGKILAGTGMGLDVADNKTRAELGRAAQIIEENIKKFSVPLTRIEINDNPTGARRSYAFSLSVEKGGHIPFHIHDIPGEWLTDPQQEGNLRGLIRQCQVILIAIDTPYLFAKTTERDTADTMRNTINRWKSPTFLKTVFPWKRSGSGWCSSCPSNASGTIIWNIPRS